MRIRRELSVHPRSAKVARDALDAVAQVVPPKRMEDLRVIVSELVTNSILRADSSQIQAIGLTVEVARGTVRLEVSDHGPNHERDSFPALEREPSQWGLLLVERLADRWGVEPGGLVWAEVRVRRRGAGVNGPVSNVRE